MLTISPTVKRTPVVLLALLLTLSLVSCDSSEERDPALTGTWGAEGTVTIFLNGEEVEGIETRTYTLTTEGGRIEGEYAFVITVPLGVYASEEGLPVTGSYDFPEVTMTVYGSAASSSATRTGTMRADGEAIDFPAEPSVGAPVVLRRQE